MKRPDTGSSSGSMATKGVKGGGSEEDGEETNLPPEEQTAGGEDEVAV